MKSNIHSLPTFLLLTTAMSNYQIKSHASLQGSGRPFTQFEIVNLKLPGDGAPNGYFLKSDNDYFIINGDILISKYSSL